MPGKTKTVAERNEELLQQEKQNIRLTAIQSEMRELSEKAKSENRDFTDDEKTRWEKSQTEFNRLLADSDRENKLREMDERIAGTSTLRSELETGEEGHERKFGNFGEMIREVAAMHGHGQTTEKRDLLISSGGSGGFMIPPQFSQNILAVDPSRAIVRSRAVVIPAGDMPDAEFQIPYFDQDDEHGGVSYTKRKEGGTMGESDVDIGLLKLKPQEQSTFVDVSKKTMENAPALASFIETRFRMGKLAKEDYLFINGSGVDQPLGLLKSNCRIAVPRNTTANIKFVDIATMMASQLDMAKGFWLCTQRAIPQLVALTDSAGNSIYIAGDVSKGIPASLLGFPIVWSTRTPAVGEEGDISFVNLDYYLIKDGSGPFIDMYDVNPKQRMLTFTSVWNVDGQVWVKNAITRDDGEKYSPIVTLAK